jgi:hypothetical protein
MGKETGGTCHRGEEKHHMLADILVETDMAKSNVAVEDTTYGDRKSTRLNSSHLG